MSGLFDKFRNEIEAARDRAASSRRDEMEYSVDSEKRLLDIEHDYSQRKQDAIAERAITLALATQLSVEMQGHLQITGTLPEQSPIYDVPEMVERGIFKKRLVQSGRTRKQVAYEGWPVLQWGDFKGYGYSSKKPNLILTPALNINLHPPLVWFNQPQFGALTRDHVHALSATPLSFDDMPWPVPKGRGIVHVDGKSFDLGYRSSPGKPDGSIRTELDAAQAEKALSFERRADYEAYNEGKVEQKIRTALFELAARYRVDI